MKSSKPRRPYNKQFQDLRRHRRHDGLKLFADLKFPLIKKYEELLDVMIEARNRQKQIRYDLHLICKDLYENGIKQKEIADALDINERVILDLLYLNEKRDQDEHSQ